MNDTNDGKGTDTQPGTAGTAGTAGAGARRRGNRRAVSVVFLGIVVLGLAAWWFRVWTEVDVPRQQRVMRTGAGVLLGLPLGLIWLFALSGWRWRVKFGVFGGIVALAAVLAGVFRFEGVTGDLVPVFRVRWARVAVVGEKGPIRPIGPIGPMPAGERGFPQFLGVGRDGVVSGVRLATNWGVRVPKLLWRQGVGEGWGGFVIAGGRALTQEQDGADELVVCYEAVTGRRLWERRDAARYDNPVGGIGPRATPTVVGDRVYAVGSSGVLNCLELGTGRRLWGTNVVGQVDPKELEWGVSSSPLVTEGWVIIAPRGAGRDGGSLVAYDAESGAKAWTGGKAQPHYSSPRIEVVLGVPQIFTFTGAGAAGHDPGTGELLWEQPWRGGHPHVMDPRLVSSNRVLISSGYGTGSRLIELERGTNGTWTVAREVWRSMRLKSKFANVLLKDGFAYGLDDGMLVCLDLADGRRRWDGTRYGHGQCLLVGDWILLTAESGDVVLVKASPEAFVEAARFHALDGKTWNPPALAGDVLIVRNAHEAAAFRLPTEP